MGAIQRLGRCQVRLERGRKKKTEGSSGWRTGKDCKILHRRLYDGLAAVEAASAE